MLLQPLRLLIALPLFAGAILFAAQPAQAAIAATAFTASANAASGAAPSATTGVTEAAAPSPRVLQDCPTNYACLWTLASWRGTRWQGTRDNTPVGSTLNNNSWSSANMSDSRVACFWDNNNGTGDHMSEGPHSVRADLRSDPKPSGGNWGDKISALTWNNCGAEPNVSNAAKAATAAMLVAAGLLSGCTSTRPESAPVASPPRLSEETVDLVTESGTYPEQRWRVRTADENSTERCMRAAGFTWTGGARPPNRRSPAQELADARRHGYGMSDTAAPADPDEEADDNAAGDPRREAALFGPDNAFAQLVIDGHASYRFPRTGCMAQAHIAVYGSLDAWARITYVPQEINLTLGSRARSDHRYQEALEQWQTCMANHRYRYVSPADIMNQLAAKYRGGTEALARRRSTEIRLAVQDVTCNQQAGLDSTEDALRREYAQQLSPAERTELITLTRLFTEARQRTATMIG